ncbi:unnamed protein product [Owenia fusiformis]|uniref:Uncharacterized protein n=1 Tax=Owenia fusiformis TaxID=6347 RepID=A0A8J1TDF7_OWEFU|nr:unnamed protein product [Owenia fusiformis]
MQMSCCHAEWGSGIEEVNGVYQNTGVLIRKLGFSPILSSCGVSKTTKKMLASQRQPEQLSSALKNTSGHIKNDIREVLGTGNYYVTPQLGHQIASVDSAINHLRLDDNLMSKEWGNKFDPNATAYQKSAAIGGINNAGEALQQYKQQFNNVNMTKLQENQIRENHEKSMRDFDGVKQNLFPQAQAAHDRIKQFCDHIGVTDRYTGYRHNLTRGSRDPVKLGFAWVDPKKNTYNATLNTGWNARSNRNVSFGPRPTEDTAFESYKGPSSWQQHQGSAPGGLHMSAPGGMQRAHTDPGFRLSGNTQAKMASSRVQKNPLANGCDTRGLGPAVWSVQEQAGINTTFPGRTEYMKRYVAPPTDIPTRDYIVNPVGDFKTHGRPLMKTYFSPDSTEYQTRYEWPDSKKIVKLPWLRK